MKNDQRQLTPKIASRCTMHGEVQARRRLRKCAERLDRVEPFSRGQPSVQIGGGAIQGPGRWWHRVVRDELVSVCPHVPAGEREREGEIWVNTK